MAAPIYVLGGTQTDFARHFTREGKGLPELIRETAQGALADAGVEAREIEVGHVGNFVGELLSGQGQLGGLLVEADPGLVGLPTCRHEAACASGSMAILAAMAELEAGRYDLALVVGVELMRGRPAREAQALLGAAAWVPRETEGLAYPWPHLMGRIGDAYDERYGLRREHLVALARHNFARARRNPLAQTRGWTFGETAFDADDRDNPVLDGRIRKQDCSQVTDGGAAVVLASPARAAEHARRRGLPLSSLPRITGWGHRTGRMALADKLADALAAGGPYLFPQVRGAIEDALRRAGLPDAWAVDAIECHDCFTTTEYMILDHLGLAPPGAAWQLIESGALWHDGRLPVNPSGGLMGVGHPVGASGVRMVLDAARQVTGKAGACQVDGARQALTVNLGGSATTTACFVLSGAAAMG